MSEQVTKGWYLPLLKGIIMMLLAILIFLSPGGVMLAWAIYIGIGFLVAGIVIVYQGFTLKGQSDDWGWRVFEGVIDILLGIMLMANPLVTASILPFIFGFWGSVYGISVFLDGFRPGKGKVVKILFGILIFLLSFIIMFNPVTAALTIAVWLGILLLMAGLANVLLAFSTK